MNSAAPKIAMLCNNTPHDLRVCGIDRALIAHADAGLPGVPAELEDVVTATLVVVNGQTRLIVNEA